jgi:hypothetical protein
VAAVGQDGKDRSRGGPPFVGGGHDDVLDRGVDGRR